MSDVSVHIVWYLWTLQHKIDQDRDETKNRIHLEIEWSLVHQQGVPESPTIWLEALLGFLLRTPMVKKQREQCLICFLEKETLLDCFC